MRWEPDEVIMKRLLAVCGFVLAMASLVMALQPALPSARAPHHAQAVKRLLIKNAMVVYGNAKPAYGPTDIKVIHGGGIEWTIKDGIPYHVPTLMTQTRDMVTQARAELAKKAKTGK